MDLPLLPPGLGARRATRADIPAITELVAACELANDGMAEIHPADVAQDFDLADSPDDVVVVRDGDALVARGCVHAGRAEVDVHPAHRGRGIGTALLRWSESRVRAAGGTRARQTVTDGDPKSTCNPSGGGAPGCAG